MHSDCSSQSLLSSLIRRIPWRALALMLMLSAVVDLLSGPVLPLFTIDKKVHQPPPAKIGKVSMLYGPRNDLYERAFASHNNHNANFGYPFFILREQLLAGFWSKPAYIMRLLLSELEKPDSERLQWLVWVDADVVLMNPNIPLEMFLPPKDNWNHIHALVTYDHRGLNNGVFFLRVHDWSVWLMSLCLTSEINSPDLELPYEDQSAMQYWLHSDYFRNNTIHVPQRWINAYAGYRGSKKAPYSDPLQPTYKYSPTSVKEGDLLVHHAGHRSQRAQRMLPWVEAAEQHLPQWELPQEETSYQQEIDDFWAESAKNESKLVDAMVKKLTELAKKKQAAKAKAAAENARKQPHARASRNRIRS